MGDPMRNRRNYYRILHVQPEAPPEIITAAYRTLMGPLRQHPDRGGSHQAAALLNEAYVVHVRFLTLCLARQPGVMVSTRA